MNLTNRGLLYAVAVGYIISIVFSVGVGIFARYVDNESNRRWCGLVTTLNEAYSSQPPATPLGARVAESIREISKDFGC